MAIELYDYQQKAVDSIFEYWKNGKKNPLLLLPTGSGKSLILAGIIKNCMEKYPNYISKILVITHVKELIEQDYDALVSYWQGANCGIYSASIGRRDTLPKIIFCGVQSIAKHTEEFGKVNLCLIDEAHLIPQKSTSSYQKIFTELLKVNPKMKIVGLTATEGRTDVGSVLNVGIFDGIAYNLTDYDSFNMLIQRNVLCDAITKCPNTKWNTEGLHTRYGDFITDELALRFDKDEITHKALSEAIELAKDRNKWLVFAINVKHAEHITEFLNSKDIPTTMIDGSLDKKEREQRINDYKAGKYRCMVNITVLATGFNERAIDCLIFLRPTKSTSLWVQSCGRGLRYHPSKKNVLCLDYCGNIERLGAINDPIKNTVKLKRESSEKGKTPFKVCPNCLTYNSTRAITCIECGFEFPQSTELTATASLQEIIRKHKVAEVREHDVSKVSYAKIKTKNGVQLLVDYYCGIQKIASDWINLESPVKDISDRAKVWIKTRNSNYMPKDTQELLVMAKQGKLKEPKRIAIQNLNGYNRIVRYIGL